MTQRKSEELSSLEILAHTEENDTYEVLFVSTMLVPCNHIISTATHL